LSSYAQFELSQPDRWVSEGTRLAYYLLDGEIEDALNLAIKSVNAWAVAHRDEEIRWTSASTSHVITKMVLSGPFLLQRLLFELSEDEEKKQEEDWRAGLRAQASTTLHLRYVKHLLLQALYRRSYHTVVALAQVLRAYDNNATWQIYLALLMGSPHVPNEGGADDRTLAEWRRKLCAFQHQRFIGQKVFREDPSSEEHLMLQTATDSEANWLHEALQLLLPWGVTLPTVDQFDPKRGWRELSFKGKRVIDELPIEEKRIATVTSPAHFERVTTSFELDDPDKMARLPQVNEAMTSDDDQPPRQVRPFPGLSSDQLNHALIEIAKAGHERRQLRAAHLHVRVDGVERTDLEKINLTGWLRRQAQAVVLLPPKSRRVELFAKSANSPNEILISYLSLPATDVGEGRRWESQLKLKGGQRIRLVVEPESAARPARLILNYKERMFPALLNEFKRIAARVASAMRRPRWAVAALGVLLIVTGAIKYRGKLWVSFRDVVRQILPIRRQPLQRDQSPLPQKEEQAQQQKMESPQPSPIPNASPPQLESAQQIELAEGAIKLTKNGVLSGLEPYSAPIAEIVRRAVQREGNGATVEIIKPSLQGGQTMGGSEKQLINVEYPNGVVVETHTPTLRWRPFPAPSGYTIKLYDDAKRFAGPILTSEVSTGTEWTTPQSLEPGHTYVWQVSTVLAGVSKDQHLAVGEGRFKVIAASDAQDIAEAEGETPRSHLVLGVLYAKAGLVDKAERELQLLLKGNPNSKVARNLLAKVRASRK
jgi:hypothetical protein